MGVETVEVYCENFDAFKDTSDKSGGFLLFVRSPGGACCRLPAPYRYALRGSFSVDELAFRDPPRDAVLRHDQCWRDRWCGRHVIRPSEAGRSWASERRAAAATAARNSVRVGPLKLRYTALDLGDPLGCGLGLRPTRQDPAESDDRKGDSGNAEDRGGKPHNEILSHATHSNRMKP